MHHNLRAILILGSLGATLVLALALPVITALTGMAHPTEVLVPGGILHLVVHALH